MKNIKFKLKKIKFYKNIIKNKKIKKFKLKKKIFYKKMNKIKLI